MSTSFVERHVFVLLYGFAVFDLHQVQVVFCLSVLRLGLVVCVLMSVVYGLVLEPAET